MYTQKLYQQHAVPWPCPVNVNRIKVWLQGYDYTKAQHLIQGLEQGFTIASTIQVDPSIPNYDNHKSALENYVQVNQKLLKESIT